MMDKQAKEKQLEKLSAIQYQVTQNNATERPYQNEYDNFFEDGIYVDVVSNEVLFTSLDKYNSGCGWPAFSKPANQENIIEKSDLTHGLQRIEVRSKEADSHLGHVFNDGPKDQGGLRYCINSAALRFIPKDQLEQEGFSEYLKLFK